MNRRTLFVASLVLACATTEELAGTSLLDAENPVELATPLDGSLRIDVLPPSDVAALPQTFFADMPSSADTLVDLGILRLAAATEVAGSFSAYQNNPQVARLPGAPVKAEGTVWFAVSRTAQSYAASTDAQGEYALDVVSNAAYDWSFVPFSPDLPASYGTRTVADVTPRVDVDLGPGVPLYGLVRSVEGPLSGVGIHAVSPQGIATATTLSEADGTYELRVDEGSWRLVAEGRALGQDPVLTLDVVDVGTIGVERNVDYPQALRRRLVEGLVVTEGPSLPPGSLARFVAESLYGYEEIDAAWQAEFAINGGVGSFLGRVVPGVYTIEIVPAQTAAAATLSPLRITGVDVPLNGGADLDLGTLSLAPLLPLRGTLTLPATDGDDDVEPDAIEGLGGVTVSCREIGFDQREWTTTTESNGAFEFMLPANDLRCAVQPPGTVASIARSEAIVNPVLQPEFVWTLQPGVPTQGTVRFGGAAVPFATIILFGADGQDLGSTITDANGAFDLAILPPDDLAL